MTTSSPTTAELRSWAQANGIKVADRGRISADVLDAYKGAHRASSTKPAAKPAPAAQTKTARTPARKSARAPKPVAARPAASRVPATASTPASESAHANDAEQESRAQKAEARYAGLEQRVHALEQRLDRDAPAGEVKPKRRFMRRS